jgi:hypothetical protein
MGRDGPGLGCENKPGRRVTEPMVPVSRAYATSSTFKSSSGSLQPSRQSIYEYLGIPGDRVSVYMLPEDEGPRPVRTTAVTCPAAGQVVKWSGWGVECVLQLSRRA